MRDITIMIPSAAGRFRKVWEALAAADINVEAAVSFLREHHRVVHVVVEDSVAQRTQRRVDGGQSDGRRRSRGTWLSLLRITQAVSPRLLARHTTPTLRCISSRWRPATGPCLALSTWQPRKRHSGCRRTGARPGSSVSPATLIDMSYPDFRLDGQVALVTGASKGIGWDLAKALADAGAPWRSPRGTSRLSSVSPTRSVLMVVRRLPWSSMCETLHRSAPPSSRSVSISGRSMCWSTTRARGEPSRRGHHRVRLGRDDGCQPSAGCSSPARRRPHHARAGFRSDHQHELPGGCGRHPGARGLLREQRWREPPDEGAGPRVVEQGCDGECGRTDVHLHTGHRRTP